MTRSDPGPQSSGAAPRSGLKNPGRMGKLKFDPITYASAGLDYGSVPALAQYRPFDTPDPSYVTGRLDISAFGDLGYATPWPFTNTNVPINGLIRIPRGPGPFPLAVFVHGNHDPLENSTPGYLYLCELLASHGIIAATIDANFLNGGNFGENDARAIVHLEHIKQFRVWNGTAGHPLHRKVNLDRIVLFGHSRGGEGVGHASLFNRLASVQPDPNSPIVPLDGSAGLGPYGFAIAGVAAIAPTDRQYEPVTGPTVVPDRYYLIHGSRDGDVFSFEGYETYNRAHAVDLANPTASTGKLKALLWVYGANHNYFNSVWEAEREIPPLTRAQQEQIARVHLGALSQVLLLDQKRFLKVLKDHRRAAAWVPDTNFVSQYQSPRRLFVMHNQEAVAPPQISAPLQGTVTSTGLEILRDRIDLVQSGGTETITLYLQWSAPGGRLTLAINPATLPAEKFRVLALRIGQSTEPDNPVGQDQDLTLEVASGSRTFSVPVSSLHRLLYPDDYFSGKIVMQSIRLPLKRLSDAGIKLRDIRSIALVLDRRPTGAIYVGDVQVSF
jgi:hypothetical protein